MLNKLDYKFKLNIRSIILYEKLIGESFSLFKPEIEKIVPLLYCIIAGNNDISFSYEDAIEFLFSDEVFMKDLSRKLEDSLKFQAQFTNTTSYKDDIEKNKNDKKEESYKPVFISQLVPILVSDCGLSIEYVMNELHYSEIDSFIQYKDEKYKARLEEERLFTYLTIAPNIDTKKLSVEKLLPFPWEKEKKKKEGLKAIERDKEKFLQFMNSGALNIDNNKNTDDDLGVR
jgi:hypothetical protein